MDWRFRRDCLLRETYRWVTYKLLPLVGGSILFLWFLFTLRQFKNGLSGNS